MLISLGVLIAILSVPTMKAYPMPTAYYFQSDMRLTAAQMNLLTNGPTRMQENVMDNFWPEKTVAYVIDHTLQKYQIDLIHEAMQHISSQSCVHFQYATTFAKPYLLIQASEYGCFSEVGYTGRAQKLNLDSNCFVRGTIVHELLHTLGFFHQHSASDRDDYVRIHFENIQTGREQNFAKYPKGAVNDFGVGYDYASIMHYKADDFSRNNRPTIEVLKKPAPSIGHSQVMSRKDIMKLNKAYKCYPVEEEEIVKERSEEKSGEEEEDDDYDCNNHRKHNHHTRTRNRSNDYYDASDASDASDSNDSNDYNDYNYSNNHNIYNGNNGYGWITYG